MNDTSFFNNKGINLPIKTHKILFFQQNKNKTKIVTIEGKYYFVFDTLVNIGGYYGDKCLRINRNTIIVLDNMLSFSTEAIICKGKKKVKIRSFVFYKKYKTQIYQFLKLTFPKLEESFSKKKYTKEEFGTVNLQKCDQTDDFGIVKNKIVDEILNNPGINIVQLLELLPHRSRRTLARRLQELKTEHMIEFKGAVKSGGYYFIVE